MISVKPKKPSFAKPPKYGNRPKRKPRVKQRVVAGPSVTGGITPGPTPTPQQQPLPADTNPSPPAQNAPTPGAGTAPPPTLPTTQAMRESALREREAALAQANQARYLAALRYGDPELIARIAAETGGTPVAEAPTSELSTIGREETINLQDLGEAQNRANTFFSGLHLRGRGRVSEAANFERANAMQRYQQSEQELTNAMAEARRRYEDTIAQALAQEIEAALAEEPEATGELPPEEPTPGEETAGKGSQGGVRKKKKKGPEKPKKQKPKVKGGIRPVKSKPGPGAPKSVAPQKKKKK